MNIARARQLTAVTSLSLLTFGVAAAPGALAKGGADVIQRGNCTGGTD